MKLSSRKKILNSKNAQKQITEDCKKLSDQENTEKEIKKLKKYRSKLERKTERLESFAGTSGFKKKLEKKSEKIMLHSKCVYVIAKEINIRLEEQAEEKMVEYATFMHDAFKLIDSSYKHSIKSSSLLKDLAGEHFFERALTENELSRVARAITLHNKREKMYQGARYTEEERLACIVHDADKISKIFKKSSWYKKGEYLKVEKYEKIQKKIRKKLLFIESENLLEEYRGLILSRKRRSEHASCEKAGSSAIEPG